MSDPAGLLTGADGVTRCWWPGTDPLYVAYHDEEWGVPVTDDRDLFEKLVLDSFQSGLSWITILRKRDSFRTAFAGFDAEAVAAYGAADFDRLLNDPGIVRNRQKIEATIANARALLALWEQGRTLAGVVWSCEPRRPGTPARPADIPTATVQSRRLAADLRVLGFRFVGPTVAYAFMQAVGVVNDHLVGCACRDTVAARRDALVRPADPGAADGPGA